ncbi:zeta-sarcoglycan-like [Babylonia areolata]|uniref:zeta-sarcoglycan-like n=1 Tax=Babylonia areolata TaxID=304850 RepID=UPI003FD360B3
MDIPSQPVGVYGWRKRCLYSLVVVLLVMVIINLALTVWILRVMDFSIDGMGKLRIVPKGIRLEGEAEFVRPLYVQEMRADEGQTLRLESARSIKMQARDEDSQHSGSLVLGDNQLQVACEQFEVTGSQGDVRLAVTEDDITVGVDEMKYLGEAVFEGSVQTPNVRGPNMQSLQLQSDNSQVVVAGEKGVSLLASSGDVQLLSDDSVRVHTSQGSILIQTNAMYMKNVDRDKSKAQAYQLCICGSSGRVFLGAADGDCQADDVCDES